jgi:hypothetical protein
MEPMVGVNAQRIGAPREPDALASVSAYVGSP